MKSILLLLVFLLTVLSHQQVKLAQVNQQNQLTPATSIPYIHPEDNWMFGSLAGPLPHLYNPPITTSYEEMLSNPKKKLISMGVNNSGIIDLNKTIVLDAEPKYVYEDDGVQGTLAPVHKHLKKLPLTEQYEEMLKDTQKKLISLGVNSTAFYDPDSQVILEGTENVNPLNVLGKTLGEIQEENKKTKKKMAKFLEDSPRFEQKNENMNDSNIHSFIIDKYGKMMKFLQMFKKKENHTAEEVKLLAKIKNYEKMIQKMSYLKKYPSDKEYVENLSSQLSLIDPPISSPSPDSQYRFNNIEQEDSQINNQEESPQNQYDDKTSPNQDDAMPAYYSDSSQEDESELTHKNKAEELKHNKKQEIKKSLNNLSKEINKGINNDAELGKEEKSIRKHKRNRYTRIQKELTNSIPEENSQNYFNSPSNELSIDYQFTRSQEAKEIATIENLIKNGERDQEAASKRLSILKSLLKNKKNQDISKNEVIYKEIKEDVQKLNEDFAKHESKNFAYDLKATEHFLKKRNIDNNFKNKFKEIIHDIKENDIPKNDDLNIAKNLKTMMQMIEGKQNRVGMRNSKYNELAKKIENTENDVESGKLYEAEENLSEINDLLNPKAL